MERTQKGNRGFWLVMILVAAYYIGGLLSAVEPVKMEPSVLFGSIFKWNHLSCTKTLSLIIAFVLIITNSILLLLLHQSFSAETSPIIPIIYIVLVISNPYALYFTPLHIASLLFILFLFCSISVFNAVQEQQRVETLIASVIALTLASFFFPPLIWLYIIAFLMNYFESDMKIKYTVSFLIGILIPLAIIYVICHMVYGTENGIAILKELWQKGTAIPEKTIRFSLIEIAKFLVIAIGIVTSLFMLIKSMGTYSSKRYSAFIRIIILLVGIIVISLVFGKNINNPFGLLMAVPTAMLLNDLFETPRANHFKSTYIAVVFLILLVERLMYFI